MTLKHHLKRMVLLCALVPLFCTTTLHAEVPGQIHYQGRIVIDGKPHSGNQDVVFRIYNDADAGALLFEETQSIVVVDGFYSAYIGANGGLTGSIFHEHPLTYLELEVAGERLQPRDRLVTVAYAFHSQFAQEAAVAHRLVDQPERAAAVEAPGPTPLHVNSTTNVSFFAHRDGMDQNIGTNGEKLVIWRVEDFDTASAMDLNNNRFVAPVTGYYRLTAQALLDPPPHPKTDPAYLARLVMRHNSTNKVASFITRYRKGQSASLATSRDIRLTAGDIIEVYLGQSHKGAATLSGKAYHSFFSGFLLHQ